MSKRILIDSSDKDEIRVAVTTNGKLDDFEIETSNKNAVKGDVFLAKITRVEPSLQAAFVDFGVYRNGVLPLTEIHPDYFKIPISDQEKLTELSLKLEGLNRNVATHAAGVVIADKKLTETVPLYKDSSADLLLPSTQFDMYSADNVLVA